MKELREVAQRFGQHVGVDGDPTHLGSSWSVPEDWTVLVAQVANSPQGSYEIGFAVDASVLGRLGGDEDGLQAVAGALEEHGVVLAAALGGQMGDEADLSFTSGIVDSWAVISDVGSYAVAVAGSPIASSEPSGTSHAPSGGEPAPSGSTGGAKMLAGGAKILGDVEMEVTAELGRTSMTIRDLLNLVPGSVVELDRMAGAPVDVLVNGKVIGRGEVVVVDEEFGVRITEILDNSHE